MVISSINAMAASDYITISVMVVGVVSACLGVYVKLSNKTAQLKLATDINKENIEDVESRLNSKIKESESRSKSDQNRIEARMDNTDKKLDAITSDINDLPGKVINLLGPRLNT